MLQTSMYLLSSIFDQIIVSPYGAIIYPNKHNLCWGELTIFLDQARYFKIYSCCAQDLNIAATGHIDTFYEEQYFDGTQ